ncbi:hypothetical protein NE237_021653 [Protea cynaroides]|uniref:Uncharacterized protein n=1 Tax=Protea cynaroides TaxID=273540 RepID=A0A9Q0K527_9MAGN|nr:hypothetical protein NE237_021653 [Protea cynaroides]
MLTKLQLFTSSLYLAALFFSFVASWVCFRHGRCLTMRLASIFFIACALLDAFALNVEMVIIGHILLGVGVGFANQLHMTIGILVASLVNYAVADIHPHGWRIALGIATVPGIMLCVGSLIITETPTSLVECEKLEEARAKLTRIRDSANVDAEFDLIVHTRFIGINAVMFYAPVNRKKDFAPSSCHSDVHQSDFEHVNARYYWDYTTSEFKAHRIYKVDRCSYSSVISVLVLMCFAWSWGPLGWLIPSETFPLETRTAGFSFAVRITMLFTFIIA